VRQKNIEKSKHYKQTKQEERNQESNQLKG